MGRASAARQVSRGAPNTPPPSPAAQNRERTAPLLLTNRQSPERWRFWRNSILSISSGFRGQNISERTAFRGRVSRFEMWRAEEQEGRRSRRADAAPFSVHFFLAFAARGERNT